MTPLTEHQIDFRVRYAETDGQGFVHHSRYIVYFEMGRTEMLRAQGGNYRLMEERGLFFVIANISVKYHAPALYDDWLTLTTRVSRQTGARLEHDYELHRGSELLTTAHTVLACVNREGQVQRIPDFSQMS